MTNEEIEMLRKTIEGVFGECKIEFDDDDHSVYVEARKAAVMILPDVVEVDTITGPRDVPGWAIGLVNGDGDFEDECTTELFWEMVTTTAELLAEQAVYAVRDNLDIPPLYREPQYE